MRHQRQQWRWCQRRYVSKTTRDTMSERIHQRISFAEHLTKKDITSFLSASAGGNDACLTSKFVGMLAIMEPGRGEAPPLERHVALPELGEEDGFIGRHGLEAMVRVDTMLVAAPLVRQEALVVR